MSIELQQIDANCNNCKHMVRDLTKYQASLALHEKWQRNYYEIVKSKMHQVEANKFRFQFNRNEAMIQYGDCSKFSKPVSFIPNTIQLDTQECFENRKQVTI